MINTVNIPKAYSEVYSFINALGNNYVKKIPEKVYNNIKDNRDLKYSPIFNKNQNIKESDLSYEALCLICALNLQYWCNNPQEKEILQKKYIDNSKKEQEKYSYENLFKNTKKEEIEKDEIEKSENHENLELVEYKDSIFIKIKNWFKRIFRINH